MFRPLTLLCMLIAAGAGYYLFQVKQSVVTLERELRDIRRQTEAALERAQVLRAEWALLNEPDRLRQVVARHLTLEPMTPAQFVRFSDLPRRTATPAPFTGAPSLFAAPPVARTDEPRAPAIASSRPAMGEGATRLPAEPAPARAPVPALAAAAPREPSSEPAGRVASPGQPPVRVAWSWPSAPHSRRVPQVRRPKPSPPRRHRVRPRAPRPDRPRSSPLLPPVRQPRRPARPR